MEKNPSPPDKLDAKPVEPAFTLDRVTIVAGKRCPTCGQLPPEFLEAFARRVDELWIDPARSTYYSANGPGQEPYPYKPHEPGPAGRYSAIIVPRSYLGKVLWLKEEDESDRQREAEHYAAMDRLRGQTTTEKGE
ncbi:MAG: hypothetical protein KGJ23_07970 [Euryarchaeota archaeon]|nr:hypothetical protein [Euryarchaeota archaeon]MDE1836537.1 hypothetical protein [Euryarchaeota archaeon]MDE1879268.1 hypothetical protein [Euryarchaeota archaeon]MDE2044507.1 hypothetical protein [Thermoplasmata archaeon]